MPDYRYELSARGRSDRHRAPGQRAAARVGERVTIGGRSGIVRCVDPLLGEREQRLIVQLARVHLGRECAASRVDVVEP